MTLQRIFALGLFPSLLFLSSGAAKAAAQPPFYELPGTSQVIEIRNANVPLTPEQIQMILRDVARYPAFMFRNLKYVDVRPTGAISTDPAGIIIAAAVQSQQTDPFWYQMGFAMANRLWEGVLTQSQKDLFSSIYYSAAVPDLAGPKGSFITNMQNWTSGSYFNLDRIASMALSRGQAAAWMPTLYVAGLFADWATQKILTYAFDGFYTPSQAEISLDSTLLSFGPFTIGLQNGYVTDVHTTRGCTQFNGQCTANGSFRTSAYFPQSFTESPPAYIQKGGNSIQLKEYSHPDGILTPSEKSQLMALMAASGIPDAHVQGLSTIEVLPVWRRPASIPVDQNWDAGANSVSLYLWDSAMRAKSPANINSLLTKGIGYRLYTTMSTDQKAEYGKFLAPNTTGDPLYAQKSFANDYSNWINRSSFDDALSALPSGDTRKLSRALFLTSFFTTRAFPSAPTQASVQFYMVKPDQTVSATTGIMSRSNQSLKIGNFEFQYSAQGNTLVAARVAGGTWLPIGSTNFSIPPSLLAMLPVATVVAAPAAVEEVPSAKPQARRPMRMLVVSPDAPDTYIPLLSPKGRNFPHDVTEVPQINN